MELRLLLLLISSLLALVKTDLLCDWINDLITHEAVGNFKSFST